MALRAWTNQIFGPISVATLENVAAGTATENGVSGGSKAGGEGGGSKKDADNTPAVQKNASDVTTKTTLEGGTSESQPQKVPKHQTATGEAQSQKPMEETITQGEQKPLMDLAHTHAIFTENFLHMVDRHRDQAMEAAHELASIRKVCVLFVR